MSEPGKPDSGEVGQTLVRPGNAKSPGPGAIRPPPRLGAYTLDRILGQGGMAAVFLAREEPSGRAVALKVMAPGLSSDPSFVERFVHEAKSCAGLHHPNIIEVFGYGEEDGWHYLACEYVEGGTLGDLISGMRELPSALAAELTAQLLAGLAHAHQAGVVHRDLKPENLLLTPGGVLKIADFGIARSADGAKLTRTGMLVGTVGYMSPEQAKGLKVDSRSDLFATGVILYEMLTGANPFHSDNPATSITRILNQQAPPIFQAKPTAPQELEALLDRLLMFEASARFAHAQEGLDALLPYLADRRRSQPDLVARCLERPGEMKLLLDSQSAAALVDEVRPLVEGSPLEMNRAAIKLDFALQLDPANQEARSLLEALGTRMRLSFGPSQNPKIAELEAKLLEQPTFTAAMAQLAQLYRLEGNLLKSAIYLKRHLRVKPGDGYTANQLFQLTGDRPRPSVTAELMAGVKTGGFKAAGYPGAAPARAPTQAMPVSIELSLPEIEAVSPLRRLLKKVAVLGVLVLVAVLLVRGLFRKVDEWIEDTDAKTQALLKGGANPGGQTVGTPAYTPPDFNRQADELFDSAAAQEQRGQPQRALELFTQYWQQSPDRPRAREALFRQAKLYLQLGRPVEARAAFDELLEKFPGSPDAAEALLRRGQASARASADEEALKDLEAFIARHPSSVLILEALVDRGEVRARRGEQAGAKADFRQVIARLAPGDPLYQRAKAAEQSLTPSKAPKRAE